MPSKTRASKRKRSDEQPREQPRTSPKPQRGQREQQQVPIAQQPPEEEIKTEPIDSTGRLTRHQAQALGKRPTSAQDEPERYLQQKARQQARTARREQRDRQMERRPGSGGGPRRVSASLFVFIFHLPHHIYHISDLKIVVYTFSG